MRLTFRVRLVVLTGLVVVLTGAGLLALDYVLIRQSLRPSIIEMIDVPFDPPAGGTVTDPGHPRAVPPPISETEHPLASLSREVEQVALREFVTQSAVALAAMSLVAVGASWFMAGRFLRPIRLLTRTARQLSGSTLHRRIAVTGPRDELTELADTFDAMLDRLERWFDAQRRFVANASHELRTPVTISRTAVDVLEAKPAPTAEQIKATIDKVRRASERSESLIDGLLLLARADSDLADLVPVDLAAVATSVLTELEPELRRRHLHVERSLERALVSGDPVLLERLVANLLENAVKYGHAGGPIGITTRAAEDGAVVLEVANTGRVIDRADADRLFEPFRRGEADRTDSSRSAGLGLSIVRSIAEAHGGAATIATRPEGGLEVTVRVPGAEGDPEH